MCVCVCMYLPVCVGYIKVTNVIFSQPPSLTSCNTTSCLVNEAANSRRATAVQVLPQVCRLTQNTNKTCRTPQRHIHICTRTQLSTFHTITLGLFFFAAPIVSACSGLHNLEQDTHNEEADVMHARSLSNKNE